MDLNWLFEATNCRVVSDSRMDCLTGPGSGRAHLWEMKVGGRSSNRFNAQSSYAAPVVVDFASPDVRINDFATSGNDTIVITGRKFGPVSQEGKWSSMIDIIVPSPSIFYVLVIFYVVISRGTCRVCCVCVFFCALVLCVHAQWADAQTVCAHTRQEQTVCGVQSVCLHERQRDDEKSEAGRHGGVVQKKD